MESTLQCVPASWLCVSLLKLVRYLFVDTIKVIYLNAAHTMFLYTELSWSEIKGAKNQLMFSTLFACAHIVETVPFNNIYSVNLERKPAKHRTLAKIEICLMPHIIYIQ